MYLVPYYTLFSLFQLLSVYPKGLVGEGNGTPLQYFCLENPMDRGAQSMGSLESDRTEQLHFHFSLSHIGEGNGNPLQCYCLENPRDGKPGGLPSMGRTESDTTEAT